MMTKRSNWMLGLCECAVLLLASASRSISASAAEIAAPAWPVPLEIQVPAPPLSRAAVVPISRTSYISEIGSSGDAREPHLHFEITTSPEVMAGEGVPYLLEQYWVQSDTGAAPAHHVHELPLGNTPVNFADRQ